LLWLGCVSKITKAHFRRLDLHIFVEKPRRSTTAPAFFVSICKPIQQNCIFQTLETHPRSTPDINGRDKRRFQKAPPMDFRSAQVFPRKNTGKRKDRLPGANRAGNTTELHGADQSAGRSRLVFLCKFSVWKTVNGSSPSVYFDVALQGARCLHNR
jgi:hypothetical protein